MKFFKKQNLFRKTTLKFFYVFSYLNFIFICSQNTPRQVDALLDSVIQESDKFNFNKSILISKKALQTSKKISYKEGIAKSNYQIAYNLCNLGNYDESFKYIKTIEKEYPDYIKDNFEFHINILDLKGRNYLAQGFKNQAREEFRKEANLSYLYVDPEKKYSGIIRSYTNLSVSCETDSAYFYMKKVLSLKDKVKDKEAVFINYINIAEHFYKQKNINIDSALYYNNTGILLAEKYNSSYLYMGILQKSELLFLQKKYDESIKYALKGLALSKERNRSEEVLLAYKLLANNFEKLGDYKSQSNFLDKYSKMNDSMFSARQAGVYASAEMIFDEQNKNENSSNKSLYIFIITSSTIILWVTFFHFKKNKKPIENSTSFIENKPKTELPNVSYEEIIALAKTNSSDFLFRFREIYPVFFKKLYEINMLKVVELSLLYLSTECISSLLTKINCLFSME